MNCVDVCPKNLNPTKAIGKIKELMVRADRVMERDRAEQAELEVPARAAGAGPGACRISWNGISTRATCLP